MLKMKNKMVINRKINKIKQAFINYSLISVLPNIVSRKILLIPDSISRIYIVNSSTITFNSNRSLPVSRLMAFNQVLSYKLNFNRQKCKQDSRSKIWMFTYKEEEGQYSGVKYSTAQYSCNGVSAPLVYLRVMIDKSIMIIQIKI